MSIPARPFNDSRNVYIVDNNDPSAFDKTYKGITGTHRELRCCRDKAPIPRAILVSPIASERQFIRQSMIDGGVDPDELWCDECSTDLERFRDDISAAAPAIFRSISAVIAYIPVLGTAAAFIINTSVSLAEGEDISESVADGIGGALPGQPASKMAYDAARAALSGKGIDKVLIAALPVDEQSKKYIATGIEVVQGIASGRAVTDVGLEQLAKQLSPMGKRALDVARRAANGENVGDIALQQAARAAKDAGSGALNNFIAQAGYQGMLQGIPEYVADGLRIGAVVGNAQALQQGLTSPPKTLGRAERNVDEHNKWEAIGRKLLISGIVWKNQVGQTVGVSNIRNQAKQENGITPTSDEWRRGFDIGIGVAEGMYLPGPGQDKVMGDLGTVTKMSGFRTAQKIQHARTGQNALSKGLDEMAKALGRVLGSDERATIDNAAREGASIAASVPQVAAARALNPDGRYRWGFDVGSAIARGKTLPGPGQTRVRTTLGPFYAGGPKAGELGSNTAMQGFDVAQALQHGIAKAQQLNETEATANQPPNLASGMLIANGLSGSGSSGDIKAGVIQQTQADPAMLAGASQVIKKKTGFFASVLRFFGLEE